MTKLKIRLPLELLENAPTLSQGHTDDLKAEFNIGGTQYRVWLSRMTVEDGMPYDNQVTVEHYTGTEWVTVDEYEAK